MRSFEMGIDIQAVEPFVNSTDQFLKKIFTEAEIAYCLAKRNPAQHFAARFAVKEAVIKALSQVKKNLDYKNIEILIKGKKPVVKIRGLLGSRWKVKVSMSHSVEYAVGCALLVYNG